MLSISSPFSFMIEPRLRRKEKEVIHKLQMGDRHAQLAKVVNATDRRRRNRTRHVLDAKRLTKYSWLASLRFRFECCWPVPRKASAEHSTRIFCILALVAKRSEQSDSLRWAASGERFRNICSDVSASTVPLSIRIRERNALLTNVLEFPLSEFCSKYVNCTKKSAINISSKARLHKFS